MVRVWDQEICSSMVLGSSLVIANMMPLKAYMTVKFRAREISRGAHKLARTPTLIIKKKQKTRNILNTK
jgi:hypothetical protein